MIVATFAVLALLCFALAARLWGRHDFVSVLSGLVGLLAFAIAMIAPSAAELAVGTAAALGAAVVVISSEIIIGTILSSGPEDGSGTRGDDPDATRSTQ